ncbi:MAG TPA: zinc ribbon domain-containing protein [Candidatus Mediterraneibacter gallistercoris]|uniref:Zinc ribbon domain-containing protein n=1 Tax=Candidatus Mediterraneibacter gallistercoris TaxID=2838671 RepID=A0A9D2P675_9FIRM|nr:zinc ribbon domain-containing protein [Candidatus Mediterraneibacter gallistercoris]
MKCKVCGQELKNGAKFCVKCGTKVEIEEQNASFRKDDEQRCSVCGKSLKPGAKFCSKCGSRVILSDLSSEESIPEEENHGQSDRKKTSDISIKMSNVENDIVNPFLLNGKNPCESILHPKLNPLQKKRKSISREVDYKELEIAKKREEEERRRQEEEKAARREEEERRRQEEEEAARRREEEERRRQEEDRVYCEEIDKKLAQMESIHEEIIPDEQSIIQNVEDNLIEVSETGQTYVPKEDHIVPQQFTRGFRTERVEKLARAKPSKLRK